MRARGRLAEVAQLALASAGAITGLVVAYYFGRNGQQLEHLAQRQREHEAESARRAAEVALKASTEAEERARRAAEVARCEPDDRARRKLLGLEDE